MSALAGRLAEALRVMIDRAACEVESLHELGRDDDETAAEAMVAQSELEAARTALAAWEARPLVPRFPTDFARKTLADYNAEIATGTVNYPFYAGAFSQLVLGVVE